MLTQTELKTFIPAIVAPCVLLYESYTGNHVSESTQSALTNGILIGVGFAVSIWGAWKNHQKKIEVKEVTPPKIPPDQSGVQIPTLLHQTTGVNTQISPIVTQEDLNKKIGG
jgi:hypothetical protein